MLKKLVITCLFVSSCFGSDLLSQMTLQEKVGQLLMAHFHGQIANDDAKILVQEVKVGGIIYYNWANGLTSPEQVRDLSSGLQRLAEDNRLPIPLLIAADQEGGVVARLQTGFTEFPGNRALGEAGDLSLAQEAALIMGREMRAVGVNMNLAPVVDVNSNPRNPVIGIRSFSDDPETVVRFGAQALQGYKKANVIATLKHFPGHGDVSLDSHEELPVIHKSQAELERCELLPFSKLSAFADAIMTAHILVPALDPDNCSTLSAKTLSCLRETLGYQGLIVSDSLVMGGVLKKCHSVDEAAILALNAGCDLLILGGKLLTSEHQEELTATDVQRVAQSILQAVLEGRIAESRVDAAAKRVLALKNRLQNGLDEDVVINAPESRSVAQKIASSALKKTTKNLGDIGQLNQQHVFVLAPQLLQSRIEKTSLLQLGKSTSFYFYKGLNPSLMDREIAKQMAKNSDVVIACSYNAWKNPSALELMESLQDRPFILLSLRDPIDATLFPDANCTFVSFSPTTPSIQAMCDQLTALKRIFLSLPPLFVNRGSWPEIPRE
jgi:beta-N-acetylhexosaminidase